MVDYIDNFFTQVEYYNIVQYCLNANYIFGISDNPNTPPTGMVSDVDSDQQIYELFSKSIDTKIEEVQSLNLHSLRINYFVPLENPYFHTDYESGITCIYYIGPIKAIGQKWKDTQYEVNDGGETQFIVKNKSFNILPIANRMCFFDSNILHRATSFRDKYRFTVAIKYR